MKATVINPAKKPAKKKISKNKKFIMELKKSDRLFNAMKKMKKRNPLKIKYVGKYEKVYPSTITKRTFPKEWHYIQRIIARIESNGKAEVLFNKSDLKILKNITEYILKVTFKRY